VNLQGGQARGSDPVGQWTVPDGSTLALQQLLAQLGYLPMNFTASSGSSGIASTPAAEEAAIVNPPQGTFDWRYPNTPAELKSLWSPTNYTELTKGAVMAFEEAQGLPTDGVAGPDVWKALINAAVKGQKSTFGYTFVMVSEGSPETVSVWHSGKIVVHGPANTGIAAAPTVTGTFAVYEHIPSGTMSGKNPDGSTYHDPGIPYISYFNGGDALHGFIRSSYGFPQSLGCVEMPFSEAGAVYPYTPIGTIVNVAG
jgi:peptidoglycan hydrolase-like protein with peptidoglycan-binding domain